MTPTKNQFVMMAAILFLLSAGVIWIRTANVRATYEFVAKEKEFERLKQNSQGLRIRWAQLTTPQRLKLLATHLGLEAPRLSQVFRHQPAGKPQ